MRTARFLALALAVTSFGCASDERWPETNDVLPSCLAASAEDEDRAKKQALRAIIERGVAKQNARASRVSDCDDELVVFVEDWADANWPRVWQVRFTKETGKVVIHPPE